MSAQENRLTTQLNKLHLEGRKALATYLINGDPVPEVSLPVMHAMVEAGANIIELAVPFSDPMADGPVIQRGHERALAHGMSVKDCIDLVRQFRQTDTTTPIVLMGYANPIERMGYKEFSESASAAGVDGLITVDLPPEEASALDAQLKEKNIASIYLVAPTTSDERIRIIADNAGGFIYYVSLKGVTGAEHINTGSVVDKLKPIKAKTSLPVLVGFGIKDAQSARQVGEHADGVVVGSAIVDIMGRETDINVITQKVAEKISEIRTGLDGR